MKTLKEITESINEKLKKEESAKITDDIADILMFEKTNNDNIIKTKDEIENLKKEKETLITVNGNLLQKVPQEKENKEEENIKKEKFNFKTIFENGKFKK